MPAHPGFVATPLRVKWRGGEPLHATLGASWSRTWLRTLCLACSGVVLFYSVMVLMQVAWMGTIGVRCLFGTDVEEEVPADFLWTPTANVEGGAQGGRRRAGRGGGRSAADWRHVALDRTDRLATRVLFRLHPGLAWAERPGWPHRQGDLERLEVSGDSCGASRGRVSADPILRLVVRLVLAGTVDFRGGRTRFLEAARRRFRPALLRALPGDSRRLHGRLPLDRDRGSPCLDLPLRVLRSPGTGGQLALLPGLPQAEPRVPASSPPGSDRALRDSRGLPGCHLGQHVHVTLVPAL